MKRDEITRAFDMKQITDENRARETAGLEHKVMTSIRRAALNGYSCCYVRVSGRQYNMLSDLLYILKDEGYKIATFIGGIEISWFEA